MWGQWYVRDGERWFRGAVRPPFIEESTAAVHSGAASAGFGGQSAPPSLKNSRPQRERHPVKRFRGAVRPPFIEDAKILGDINAILSFGGQSAPPSLKKPPVWQLAGSSDSFGGQSAPPSLKSFRA